MKKEREKITGFVFQIEEMGGQNVFEIALEMSTGGHSSESKYSKSYYRFIELGRKHLKNCKYKVEIRIDYGYYLEFKVDLPEPICTFRNYHDKAESLRDEIIKYFWEEYKLAISIQEEKGWYFINYGVWNY